MGEGEKERERLLYSREYSRLLVSSNKEQVRRRVSTPYAKAQRTVPKRPIRIHQPSSRCVLDSSICHSINPPLGTSSRARRSALHRIWAFLYACQPISARLVEGFFFSRRKLMVTGQIYPQLFLLICSFSHMSFRERRFL